MTAVLRKISVGTGGKHTLSPEKSLPRSKRKVCETTLTIDRARYACHYGGEDKEGVQ